MCVPHLKEWAAVAQLVEALRYKPEGRGHWNFS
jgi:2-keto-3-deoxy-L-rhamnonate aldolase RhmA